MTFSEKLGVVEICLKAVVLVALLYIFCTITRTNKGSK